MNIKINPKVSVVIPFYSSRRGVLNRAVRSVINQTFQDFEIIIIDDCSLLDAASELEQEVDQRIKIIRNTRNMNGAYSRNKGIREAKGEFIALLDADDFYLPGHLYNCILKIQNNDFIYSNIVWYTDGTANYKITSLIKHYNKENICDILLDSPPQTNSFFFKKSCFPAIKFNETLNRHQDYQFFIDFCASRYKVNKINSFTACYVPVSTDRVVDYNSIINYWISNRNRVSRKKLHKFMIGIGSSITRQKKYDFSTLEKINNELCQDFCLKIILLLKSKIFAKYALYIYYHFVLDIKKILPKVKGKMRKILSLRGSNDTIEL